MVSVKRSNGSFYFIVLVLIFIGVFLPACGGSSQPVVPTQEAVTPTAKRTNTPSPQPITKIPPTPTEQPPKPYLTNCISMLDELPEIDDLEGRIIFDDRKDIFIYEVDTESRVALDALWETLVVSPDYSMVAYLDDSYRRLIVSDIDGNVIKSFWTDPVNPDQDIFPVQWLDTQYILMFAAGKGEYPNYLVPYAAIFDLEVGRSEKIAMDFPGINLNYHEHGAKWYLKWRSQDYRLAVSPDQELFVYPAKEGTDVFLVIWEKDYEEELFRFPGIRPHHTVPRWSPDGEQFAILSKEPVPFSRQGEEEVSGDEIFLLDRFGNYEKITAFETDSPGNIYRLSWSPDSQRIAFWFEPYYAADYIAFGGRLFVINLITNTVVDYCISGGGEINWSLDGNYVFIGTSYQGYNDVLSTTLVDLEDLWAVTILEHAEVEGVLNEE